MRVLLTGPTGQVGSALTRTLPAIAEVIPAGRDRLDLSDPESIRRCVRAARPDVIVNAAAYTAVDRAETEEALAMQVNAQGPSILAEEANNIGALLVHFSTDYVFDGEKNEPYVETDAPNPLNAYGRSKLAGERAIQSSGCRHLIFRTSWVYSAGGSNFLLTMLRLAKEGKPLRVVDDQIGAPTSSSMIARVVTTVIRSPKHSEETYGIYHLAAAGETSWHGFAKAIFQTTGLKPQIQAVTSSKYPTAARRPHSSRLDTTKLTGCFDVTLERWDAGVHEVALALRDARNWA